ncbi:magnesium-translocating P-type ATPase [Chamaesiphon minutus]|uniref:Magnesium-transporting ATPase, P-type 1 n=1 Tax=Chamaesiphon minutus (strain ATCC 27169 / PCC 6605) TaxID=1173020 RepID=K9UC04_CHAP6|nr:magnesium-translocating P-type ATPase [Chamaesiphon minutus]AFY92345.1 magnesium-translocating P-type ATPase [Chamaesiphon minutus PCC 6605]
MNNSSRNANSVDSSNALINIAQKDVAGVLKLFDTTLDGLTETEAQRRLLKSGLNEIARKKPSKWYIQLLKTVTNPLSLLLIALGTISLLTGSPTAAFIIFMMVIFGGLLRFSQEFQSNKAAEKLREMVSITAAVSRQGNNKVTTPKEQQGISGTEIAVKLLVPGDIVFLSAGDMIPADIRLIVAKDLFLGQSTLTGESLPVEKHVNLADKQEKNPLELVNLCFMGTTVVSGSGTAVVAETGSHTYLASIAKTLGGNRVRTSFDKAVNSVTTLLLRFMLIMAPLVFLINGVVKHNWVEAFTFALSVAVGLAPEMLPVIVTANLAKGAIAMSDKKVIVKNIDAIQDFGSMNILCTDKTGTLTQDKIVLQRHLDPYGKESLDVLKYAYLNSFYQTGLKNLLDVAVLERKQELTSLDIDRDYHKFDEIPFDFVRRRMSVIIAETGKDHVLICKGAVEEVLKICTQLKVDDKILPIDESVHTRVADLQQKLNSDGLRVIAVAYKTIPIAQSHCTIADESNLILLGNIAFLDPPKDSAAQALKALKRNGVDVKILTGDNEIITQKICRDVGLPVQNVLLGSDIESLADDKLAEVAATTTIFAKFSPTQKAKVIQVLRKAGNIVGYMGDGINDAAALREADVGISVDTAADVAKESADIILLEKNLLVLESGVTIGRQTFSNIVKYIRMGTSSNFGNMFSVLGASALLPFLPMQPVQILINNLLYDFSQTGIPFDNVDKEDLVKPPKWKIENIRRFMIFIGPISSIFDYATYALMWFVFGAKSVEHQALFQTGWFVESLMTQTLIVHVIRTAKVPFFQSRASLPMLLITATVMCIGMYLPFSPIGSSLGFVPLPAVYFLWLAGILTCYCVLTQLVKTWFIKKYGYT